MIKINDLPHKYPYCECFARMYPFSVIAELPYSSGQHHIFELGVGMILF